MTIKKTLLRKVVPIVATSLFGIGTLIGIQGDRLKYGEVHERFPQVQRNPIYGYISNLQELSESTVKGIEKLEEKASDKYGVAAPLMLLGGLSFLGASLYSSKKKD